MTWDAAAALLVVAGAVWLLRWAATRGSCASCPTQVEAGASKARVIHASFVRKRPDQLRLAGCTCASADKAAEKAAP